MTQGSGDRIHDSAFMCRSETRGARAISRPIETMGPDDSRRVEHVSLYEPGSSGVSRARSRVYARDELALSRMTWAPLTLRETVVQAAIMTRVFTIRRLISQNARIGTSFQSG